MYEDDFSTLFTKDDWRPISFHMEPNGVQRKRIKDLVEANSGYLFDTFPRDESNHLIRLANFDSIIINKNEDFFDVKYVECCVEAGKLLPNLIDYRINKRTSYADYNPFDVMVGRIRWNQVPKKAQGEKVEFDDFSENIERNKRYLEFYEFSTKKAYTRKEDIAILKYIQDYQVYSQVDGNLIWKKMQLKKVCNRSYQSMKERFRKQILPQINSYGLSQKQIKCFQEKREIYTPLRNMETSDSDGSLTPPPTAEQHRSRLRKKSREKNDPPSRGSRDNILRGAATETENSCSSSPSRRTRRPEHGNSQSSPRHYPPKGPEKPDSREQQRQNNGNRDQLLKEAIFGSSILNSQADNAELNDTDQEPFRVIQPSMSDANSESEEEVIKKKSSQEDENTKQQRTDQYKKDKPDKHKNSTKGKERTKSTEDNSAKNSANEDSARNAADESELRDAGVQRILFQDINIDSGAKAATVNKRTFSTDSDKSPRKKRKLYCPERSHLSENVLGHVGVFQIPSPVLTSGGLQKKKASGSSRKELQDVASSSQEFAAGLRAASDVSQTSNDLEEPGLELTTTSLGGITSTQNIIEDSETPQTKKAPLPSVDENSLEEVTNKNDADLRTRSSTTRFANKNLLAKTSRKEGQNALQQVGEAYEDEGGSQELHLYLQPSQDQENKNDEEDKNESINLLQASDDKAIENSPPQESPDNYRILTNDRSLMVPMESDIFASDSDFESTKGQESHKEPENENNVVNVPNIDLDSSELQDPQVVDDPCIPEVPGVSPDIPNEVELANENEEIDHTEQRKNIDLDSSELQDKHVLDDPCPKDGGSPDVPGEIIPDINTVNGEQDYQIPVDHVEGAFDHLQAGNDLHNIVTDNVFEDHVDDPMDHPIDDPIDDQEVESEKDTDGEELQGVFSGQQLEQEEEIAIAGEERVDDSEEETRIRNKTTFQKRPLTKPAGKSRSGKKRRDLLVIEVPHDVGSSDIEIVRPGRHRKDSTSSQENSSQEVQRPRPKSRRRRRSSAAANTAAGPSAASAAAGPSTATTAAGPSAAGPSNVDTAAGPSTVTAAGSNVSTSENSISSSETASEKIEEKKTITIRRKEDPGDMFRKPYTQEEERKLLAYFDTHGGYSRRKGKALWEELERKRVLPGRSWQSMKSWFLKLLKNSSRLDTYGTSVAQLIDADKEIYRIDTDGEEEEGNDTTRGGGEVDVSRAVDQSIGGSKKKTIPYTVEEDKKILKFIIENKRYAETSGIALWKLMESGKVVGNRSYHSMKERFRKIIIKNIDNSKYGLTYEELDNFSSSDRRKNATQKRHKK